MKKKNIIVSLVLVIVSIIYTILVKCVDLGSIGPEDSMVGFSTINKWFADIAGTNNTFYDISEYLGYAAILLAGIWAGIGFLQLVIRKSLAKVDKEIYAVAGLYVVVVILYALFEVVIINYRPVLIEGVLEASYPSSHTLLSLCICGSTALLSLIRYKKYNKLVVSVSTLLMVSIVLLRLFSGVHWLTDIIGGVIISSTLLYIFYSVLLSLKKKVD